MHSSLRRGDAFIWLTGGGLAIGLIMVVGLVLLILVQGLGFFWPKDVAQITLCDARSVLGEVVDRETARRGESEAERRIKIKRGNRDTYGADFVWLFGSEI